VQGERPADSCVLRSRCGRPSFAPRSGIQRTFVGTVAHLPLFGAAGQKNSDLVTTFKGIEMLIKNANKKLLTAAAVMVGSMGAQASTTFQLGEDVSLTPGYAMRYSYTNREDSSANGGHSTDFHLDSGRFMLGASFGKTIKATLSTERVGGRNHFLDAFGQFEFMPEFNIWAGRLVSPSDRANMAGPYYSMGGGYWPGVASRYGWSGGKFVARDDGVSVWGTVADGRLGYSIGGFEGRTFGVGSLTKDEAKKQGVKTSDSLMYAGRLQYDFWDKAPGYYNIANWLGAKDILSVGAAFRYQDKGVLTTGGTGDYTGYNFDFLLEKRIKGSGTVAFEAAWYDYDTDNVIRAEQGKAYSTGLSYIFEHKLGWGRLQPFTHWQKFEADSDVNTRQYDLGVNYVIDGYNTQLSATFTNTKVTGALASRSDLDKFAVTLQLQF
jgi:hypothetical protein